MKENIFKVILPFSKFQREINLWPYTHLDDIPLLARYLPTYQV